ADSAASTTIAAAPAAIEQRRFGFGIFPPYRISRPSAQRTLDRKWWPKQTHDRDKAGYSLASTLALLAIFRNEACSARPWRFAGGCWARRAMNSGIGSSRTIGVT